ncbi:MAG TPA: Gfo/Idh/MocA family oxidoreductase [Patescibacteria group bacterium]|jgi:predicted dehydrogenase|nr:Gfo/Idh/MocA family oxidoreductase [Patescibacteria group bacterium]
MTPVASRRAFLKQAGAIGGTLAFGNSVGLLARAASPNQTVRIGIIGCNGRGKDHIAGYLSVPNTEIAYICDVDGRARDRGVELAGKKQSRKPVGVTDLRRVLDDPEVDAVSIATPDHWHAPAAILACAAGKHVYVEKPGSHNLHESQLLVAAAKKHRRVVQMGTQRRSWPWIIEAIESLHEGEIGALYLARAWYTNHRPTIGRGKIVSAPDWLDWKMWQGPAPEEPLRDNLPHYNWHWFWSWGTGELGNNGVHALDLARWGLSVEYPKRVTCGGNRYHFRDDWQTPDSSVASFDFNEKGIVWDCQSCDPHGFENSSFGASFYGENGAMVITDKVRVYDLNEKLVREAGGKGDDIVHFANFVGAIRDGRKLSAEISDAEKSTVLCHLGNIAWRSGETVHFDPSACKLEGDKKLRALATRNYRPGWEPKV